MTTIKAQLHIKNKGLKDYSFCLVFDPEKGYGWQVEVNCDSPLSFLMQLDPEDNRIKITEPLRTTLPKQYSFIYEMETAIAEKITQEIVNL